MTKPRRSLLFVPASRPERFAKAEASGADMVCLDLEDAVAGDDKAAARAAALAHFATPNPGVERVLRINPVTSAAGEEDLAALAGSEALPGLIMLPKVESPEEILAAATVLAGRGEGFIAMIESAAGMLVVRETARAHPLLVGLMFGGADFAADIGARMAWEPLLHARGELVLAAAGAGLLLVDVPCFAFADDEALAAETNRVQAMGFTTKSAVHPRQIPVIHDVFMPSAEELDRARRVVAADREARGGVAAVDGEMIDRPVVLAALRVLARAGDAAE